MAKSHTGASKPTRAVFSSSSGGRNKASGGSYSKRTTNASGFAHRQSKRNALLDEDPLEVFDLVTQKHKRDNVRSELSRDEAGTGKGRRDGGDRDDDDDPNDDDVRARIQRMVAGQEVGVVEEDDDEDIESDEAWEEMGEDQNTWGGAFMSKLQGGKRPRVKAVEKEIEVDLAESDDEAHAPVAAPVRKARFAAPPSPEYASDEDEGFNSDEAEEAGGFVDLSAMLDGPAPSDDEAPTKPDAPEEEADEMSMGEDDDEEEDDEEDDDDDDDDDDDELDFDEEEDGEDDAMALDQLGSFISNLKSGKRKADDDDDNGPLTGGQKAKRRVLRDRGEDGRKEGEFGAPLARGTKLSLTELLQPLPQTASLSLLKSAKALAPAALAAPLPTRAQEKIDRAAAYEATKEEVDKWAPAMKRIKEAEHLSFPLQAQKKAAPSSASMTAKFKPSNDLESAVANLLASAQMSDADIAKTEELAMNNLTLEEVAARRAELARVRELMFRAEAKAKRVSKIKSKAYRKIAKKERERNAEKLADAGFGADETEDDQLERERKRATERATLRHKNTGKWAKSMLGRHELDVDQRRELNEQLEQGDRLKRKIQGRGDGGSDDSESDDEDDDGDDDEGIRQRAFDQLAQLDAGHDADEDAITKKSGLFEMKFMTDGMARAQKAADLQAARLQSDLVGDGDLSGEEDDDQPGLNYANVGGNAGRLVYGQSSVPATKKNQSAANLSANAPPSDASAASTGTLQSSNPPVPSPPLAQPTPEESNPWLTASSGSAAGKISRKKNALAGREAVGAEKTAVALKKNLARTEDARERERDDAAVEIDPSAPLVAAAPKAEKRAGKTGAAAAASNGNATQADAGGDTSDSDDGEVPSAGPMAFRQRDLVAQAFAGDNVIEDFAAEKRREEEADAPKEEDLTLPGWGAWGGKGVKKPKNAKKFTRKVAGIEVAKRHDFGKSNVIISERKDKKAAKYQTKDLPYPYTSAAQYEASLSQAVGTEWATRGTHQKLTLPRVVTKMGTIIHPMAKGDA